MEESIIRSTSENNMEKTKMEDVHTKPIRTLLQFACDRIWMIDETSNKMV